MVKVVVLVLLALGWVLIGEAFRAHPAAAAATAAGRRSVRFGPELREKKKDDNKKNATEGGNSISVDDDNDKYLQALSEYDKHNNEGTLSILRQCNSADPRCQCLLGDFYFLGLQPLRRRSISSALVLWKEAADGGSADAQFRLGLVYSNFFNVPTFATSDPSDALGRGRRRTSTAPSSSGTDSAVSDGAAATSDDDSNFENHPSLTTTTKPLKPPEDVDAAVLSDRDGILTIPKRFREAKTQLEVFDAEVHSQSFPDPLRLNDPLALTYFYAAAYAKQPGALMALGFRHERGIGVPKSCNTAVMYYMEVARNAARIQAKGMPQAVELIRLALPTTERHKALKSHQIELHLHVAEQGNAKMQASVGKRFLIGVEGFRQNYYDALYYLKQAAESSNGEALGLLGYMFALGLGVEKDLDSAAEYFYEAAIRHDDPFGHNGLGYINFVGTSRIERNHTKAFHHFRESAALSFPDAQFNLGSMYLTGSGVSQSFQKAMLWYTRALEQGHTPAAYALALMHLNAFGTIRDCPVALTLLKRVCERGSWVASGLQKAYEYEAAGRYDEAAFVFWQLAEGGHEVSQSNFAYLLDFGHVDVFSSVSRPRNRAHSQRFYEMSASQGSILSELRLGDFAHYGWGLEVQLDMTLDDHSDSPVSADGDLPRDYEGKALTGWIRRTRQRIVKLERPNYTRAFSHYKRASELAANPRWAPAFVAKALHNLGHLYEWGLGVPQDFHMARRMYKSILEVDSGTPKAAVLFSQWLLKMHETWTLFDVRTVWSSATTDRRLRVLTTNFLFFVALWLIRPLLKATAERQRQRARGAAT